MDLVIRNPKIPIKGWDQKKLDEFLMSAFKFWLVNLLGVKADKEDIVNMSLQGIKEHCRSMGMGDVKKAFELYVDGKLTIEPISNHLDRALVGRIMSEYKKTKHYQPTPPEEKETPQHIKDQHIILNAYESWKKFNKVIPGFAHVYDILDKYSAFNELSKEVKWEYYKKSLESLKKDLTRGKSEFEAQEITQELEKHKNLEVIRRSKQDILDDYFRENNIKEIINQIN